MLTGANLVVICSDPNFVTVFEIESRTEEIFHINKSYNLGTEKILLVWVLVKYEI